MPTTHWPIVPPQVPSVTIDDEAATNRMATTSLTVTDTTHGKFRGALGVHFQRCDHRRADRFVPVEMDPAELPQKELLSSEVRREEFF